MASSSGATLILAARYLSRIIYWHLHENEYSATLGERKKAPTIIGIYFHYQWRKHSYLDVSFLFSSFT
jgi:hypothetical protein